jgi:DNA-binding MarR family transcriptional regulator
MFTDINNSLNSLVYKTNIILKGKLQIFLKDFNITTEQWVMLSRLYQKDGYNQKELSIDSFKEQAAITRTLDILENKGLVERKKSPADRREYLILITAQGKELLEKSLPSAKRYRDLLDSVLDKEEMEMLASLLNKLYKGLLTDL